MDPVIILLFLSPLARSTEISIETIWNNSSSVSTQSNYITPSSIKDALPLKKVPYYPKSDNKSSSDIVSYQVTLPTSSDRPTSTMRSKTTKRPNYEEILTNRISEVPRLYFENLPLGDPMKLPNYKFTPDRSIFIHLSHLLGYLGPEEYPIGKCLSF